MPAELHRLGPNPAPDACLAMLVAGRDERRQRSEDDHDTPQARAFLTAIGGAREWIRIRTPALDETDVQKALVAALSQRPALRVELLLSTEAEVPPLHQALADLGVTDACERLTIRRSDEAGTVQVASIDGRLAIAGSAGLDVASWRWSREVNVVVEDEEIVGGWDARLFGDAFSAGDDARGGDRGTCGPLPPRGPRR